MIQQLRKGETVYAYDYCRAVARHIDRRMGMKLMTDIVETERKALRYHVGRHHRIAAGLRLMRVFAPEIVLRYDDLPHGARAMARQIIYAVFEDEQPEPEIFAREPVMQRALAVAMRIFVDDLINEVVQEVPQSKPAAVELPPHVEREVARLMRLPQRAITAKA